MISKVTDADGRITVPGFYDDVEEVPQAEREMIARIPFDEEKYKKAIGVNALFGEKGTVRWSVTVAVRLSMYAASGAAIRAKVPKPYSLPKPMPKYRADWFRIRITIKFRNCLPIISWLSLPTPYR